MRVTAILDRGPLGGTEHDLGDLAAPPLCLDMPLRFGRHVYLESYELSTFSADDGRAVYAHRRHNVA